MLDVMSNCFDNLADTQFLLMLFVCAFKLDGIPTYGHFEWVNLGASVMLVQVTSRLRLPDLHLQFHLQRLLVPPNHPHSNSRPTALLNFSHEKSSTMVTKLIDFARFFIPWYLAS
jgi:hypothetical protein